MALTSKQIEKLGELLVSLKDAFETYIDKDIGDLQENPFVAAGSIDSLRSNHAILTDLQKELSQGVLWYDEGGGVKDFEDVWPITIADLGNFDLVKNVKNLEDFWTTSTFPQLNVYINLVNSLDIYAKQQLDNFSEGMYVGDKASSGNVAAAQNILNLAKQFVNEFGQISFGRKKLGPPSEPTSEADLIMVDIDLEISLSNTIGQTPTATHYIGLLEDPKTSSGTRSSPYLPVRLAPAAEPTPLNSGWDDNGYHVLDNNNKLIGPIISSGGYFEINGIEIPLGTGINIVETVLGSTGMWVGFVTAEVGHAGFTEYTQSETRVLYTRPKYIRRLNSSKVSGGSSDIKYVDPVLNHTMISIDTPNNRAAILGNLGDGVNLVSDKNLNWTGMKYGDVQFAYYNFTEANSELNSKINAETIGISNTQRLRLSEGYYYFVTIDGSRQSVGDLLNVISIPPSGDPSNSEKIIEAKKEDGQNVIKTAAGQAIDMVLEYNGKARPEKNHEWLALRDIWTILVDQRVLDHAPKSNNQKMLFAIPASIIEALPNTKLSYLEQFESTTPNIAGGDQPQSDFYEEFGEGGKNFVFTLKMADLNKTTANLVKVLTKIKERLEDFKSTGGVIKNQNNINFNIQSQIDRIQEIPQILGEFIKRQGAPMSPDRDYLTSLLQANGLQQKGTDFIQVGIRSNGEIGFGARYTISFVLFSPDPEVMKTIPSDRTELRFLDPYITEEELNSVTDTSRSAIALTRALPWLRSKFLDVEGSRTLHYLFAHRNMIQFDQTIEADFSSNNWVKFLQAYTVPPLAIKLSADRAQDPEEIDCKKLLEEMSRSSSTLNEADKKLQEKIEKYCKDELLRSRLKKTSASDPESSRHGLHMKQLISKNVDATLDAAISYDTLLQLYDGFLHKLDVNGLIALLIACLAKKNDWPTSAYEICKMAIEKLVEAIGLDEIKKQILTFFPELAIFLGPDIPELPDTTQQMIKNLNEFDGNTFTPQQKELSDQFVQDFKEELVQNPGLKNAPIAIALSERVLENNLFAIGFPLDKNEGPSQRKWGASTIDMIAKLERSRTPIPLEPFWTDPYNAYDCWNPEKIVPFSDCMNPNKTTPTPRRFTTAEIAAQHQVYLDSGYNTHEARACLIRDGYLEVSPFFLKDTTVEPPDVGNMITTSANALSDLGKTFLSAPPSPQENAGNVPWAATTTGVGNALSKADEARKFVQWIEKIIDLQQLCEGLVGAGLAMPGMLFTRPSDFVATWKNWYDNLVDRLKRQFRFPEDSIPSVEMPDTLPTDDLIKDYADKLLAAFATMTGMILGEILNMILKEYLEKCLMEEEVPPDGAPASDDPLTIPLPVLEDMALNIPDPAVRPDFVAWLRAMIDYLNVTQLCNMLQGTAGELTVEQILNLTKNEWPLVWNAGIDNAADVKQIFIELGERVDLRICDAIQAIQPILVDACEDGYDWDARCAELQMQGLTKEECDAQIKKELDDLRNKLSAMAGFMFPDANPLDHELPHPCGPNGYFQLPSAMKNTMSVVTDNFLKGVKSSVIRDLQGVKFMTMPPRAVELITDPEKMIETHREFNDAIEDKIEKLTLMPVVETMFTKGSAAPISAKTSSLNLEKHNLEFQTENLFTYTRSITGLPGYSRAGVESFDEKEVYKAIPHSNHLNIDVHPDNLQLIRAGRDFAPTDQKPKSLLNVGHFNSDMYAKTPHLGQEGIRSVPTFLEKEYVNSAVNKNLGPKYPYKSSVKAVESVFRAYAEELYKNRFGGDTDLVPSQGTIIDDKLGKSLKDSAPNIAQDINSMFRGDKKDNNGMLEPSPPGLHRKMLSYMEYRIIYITNGLYKHSKKVSTSAVSNYADQIAYLRKYTKMYKLTDKVKDLMPPGTIWFPDALNNRGGLPIFGKDDASPSDFWPQSAKPAFISLMCNFLGLDPEHNNATHYFNKTIKDVKGSTTLYAVQGPGRKAAIDIIAEYAKNDDRQTLLDAFAEMPIGVAVGLEKHILRYLYPRWWGLYESIEEEGGVILDLSPMYSNTSAMGGDTVVSRIFPDYAYSDVVENTPNIDSVRSRYDRQIKPKFVVRKDFFRDPEGRLENLTPDSPLWPKPNETSRPISDKFVNAFDNAGSLAMKETFPPALYKKTTEKLFSKTLKGVSLIAEDVKTKIAYEWDIHGDSYLYGDAPFVPQQVRKWKTEPTYVYYRYTFEDGSEYPENIPPSYEFDSKTDLIEYFSSMGYSNTQTYYDSSKGKWYVKLYEGYLKAGPNGKVESPLIYESSPYQGVDWYYTEGWSAVKIKAGLPDFSEEELEGHELYKNMKNFDYYLYSNFNPDVCYWPMPFKNPLALGDNAEKVKDSIAGVQNIMARDTHRAVTLKPGHSYLLQAGERISASSKFDYNNELAQYKVGDTYINDTSSPIGIQITTAGFSGAEMNAQGLQTPTLLYQDFPIEIDQKVICSSEMKDCYKISKAKLSGHLETEKFHATPHNPTQPLTNQYQINEPEFDYEIVEDYHPKVLSLLKNIGISSPEDCINITKEMKGVKAFDTKDPFPKALQNSFNDVKNIVEAGHKTQISNPDERNYNQAIFAQLLTSKLDKFIKKHGEGGALSNYQKSQFKHFLGTYDYSACKLAYSSKIFGKLRLSRLNQRKFMNKLWNKILQTPLTDKPMDPRCLNMLQELAVGTTSNFPDGVETDFFDIDSVKPEIIDFYEKSVCADVYSHEMEEYTASQKALIEGAIILLIRVYTLELCLAGIISWDAYNIEDVFSQPIMTRLLVKNIKKDIENMEVLYLFINDIVKKKRKILNPEAYTILNNESAIQIIMREEAAKINTIVNSMFRFRNPVSADLSLSVMTSQGDGLREKFQSLYDSPQTNFQWYPGIEMTSNYDQFGTYVFNTIESSDIRILSEVIGNLAFERNVDYSAISMLNNNIYTHNYGIGRLENSSYYNAPYLSNMQIQSTPFSYTSEQKPRTLVYGGSLVSTEHAIFPTQDFSGNETRHSQKNFFHSVPLTYNSDMVSWSGLLADEQNLDEAASITFDYGDQLIFEKGLPFQFDFNEHIDAVRKPRVDDRNLTQRILQDRLLANAGQFENKHENIVGNNLNARMGNFIFQTYVTFEDEDLEGRKKYKARNFTDQPTEPCDLNLDNQGSLSEAHVLLGDDPILQDQRSEETNPFGAYLYGTVSLEVFSWFINHAFFPWVSSNDEMMLLFNAHGFKPFFKNIKMGLRMTHVSNFGTAVQSEVLNTSVLGSYAGTESLIDHVKEAMREEGLKRSKSVLCQRTYVLSDYQYRQDSQVYGEVNYGATSSTLTEGLADHYKDLNITDIDPQNTKQLAGDWWPQLFHEIHIPIVEIERDIEIDGGQIKVGKNYYDFNEFSHAAKIKNSAHFAGLGHIMSWSKEESLGIFQLPGIDSASGNSYESIYRSIVQNPGNFYYKHLASDMLAELQDSAEFKLIFDHLIPVKRYMALGFLYSSDAILEILGDPTQLLEEAKQTIINMINGILDGSNDYTFIPAAVTDQLKADLLAMIQTTSPNQQKSMRKRIMEIIYRAMLLVLRGFVELTDPAVIIAQKIIDISKMIYETIIMTLEQTYYAIDASLQQSIDITRNQMQQIEMTLHMAKTTLDPGLKMAIQNYPPQAEPADGDNPEIVAGTNLKDGGAEFNLDGDDVTQWSVTYDDSFVPAKDDPEYKKDNPMSGEWETKWTDFTEVADGFMDALKEYSEAKKKIDDLQAKKDDYAKNFGEKIEEVKKYMSEVFGSKFLLPGMWAALLPSMTPYLGGIIPPPFFIGPPSTIPGMIYLVLLMGDAYDALEEEVEEEAEKTWQEKCAEQL